MNDAHDPLFPDGTRRAGEDIVLAGRYRVVRRLGGGAMGTVYLAKDTKLEGMKVAIKMLPSVLAGDKSAMKALKREAVLARRLSHPHIVALRHFEEGAAAAFVVMDYVEGQSLADRLAANGPLSEERVLAIFQPLAEALDHAHGKGVIHRDIKPGNIMLEVDGTPLLVDFGIACELKNSMTRLTGRMSSGTLPYMSPEQLRGDTLTPAQDVYSLAATIYECLAGHPPFHQGQIEWQILNKKPMPPPGGATPLRTSVLRGLAKQPEGRPPKCRALLADALKRPGDALTSANTSEVAAPTVPSSSPARADHIGPSNPCKFGTRMHLVCDAALAGRTTQEAEKALDGLAPGAGRRLREYVSDLRHEHGLDVRIDDGRLRCAGRIGGASNRPATKTPSAGRPRLWLLALLAIAMAVGGWSLLNGSGDGGAVGPTTSLPMATLTSPLERAWVRTPRLSVHGRVGGGTADLLLNGAPLAVVGGAFQQEVGVGEDGTLAIEVSTGGGEVLASREVRVDRTAPVIEITSPVQRESTTSQVAVVIQGRVMESHLAKLTVNGTAITPASSGRFTWPVTLTAGRPTVLVFTATDEAGNEAESVSRELTYERPIEPWETLLASAEDAVRGEDWRKAARLLEAATAKGLLDGRASRALVEGVKRWTAVPTLDIDLPAGGLVVDVPALLVRGTLKSGRATDRVFMNGKPSDFAGGAFSALVPLQLGRNAIRVEVRDGNVRRGDPVVIEVERHLAWKAKLHEAASLASKGDKDGALEALRIAVARGARGGEVLEQHRKLLMDALRSGRSAAVRAAAGVLEVFGPAAEAFVPALLSALVTEDLVTSDAAGDALIAVGARAAPTIVKHHYRRSGKPAKKPQDHDVIAIRQVERVLIGLGVSAVPALLTELPRDEVDP